MKDKTVLWIDDDQWEWGPIRRRIRRTGATLVEAVSAVEGLKLLQESSPSAIVLDILLPAGPGLTHDRAYPGLAVWKGMTPIQRDRTIILSVMLEEDLKAVDPAIQGLRGDRMFDKVSVDRSYPRFEAKLSELLATDLPSEVPVVT